MKPVEGMWMTLCSESVRGVYIVTEDGLWLRTLALQVLTLLGRIS